ncbi:MAG: hypothetical protein F6K10_09770 [Moorea sp. SIO2B7]|nr:hypothetical protein [Moorena sp. SIO2B7]
MIITEKGRVGLVLSGGGSRGAYHIGVIKYLAEKILKLMLFLVLVLVH